MLAKLHYRWYTPYVFLLPGLILYILWMIYPLLYQFYISFFKWNPLPGQESPFVGLQNYQAVLMEPRFWTSLLNALIYAFVTVSGQMFLGLALAILVHRVIVAKRLFRAIYYIPVITSWVVVSFLFTFLFSSDGGGLINYILVNTLHIINKPIAWYSEASTAWVSLYTLGIWKGMGWAMVLFLAALQGIPQELYEAASIDGATEWQQFFWTYTAAHPPNNFIRDGCAHHWRYTGLDFGAADYKRCAAQSD